MAGKVQVKTVWHENGEPYIRVWRGYNVNRKLRKVSDFADNFGKWYVYRQTEGHQWCLIHGETGLSAGYGDTIKEAVNKLGFRQSDEVKKAVAAKASINRIQAEKPSIRKEKMF
jgi:hypothetical protein